MSGNRISAGPGIVKPVQDQDEKLHPLAFDAWNRPKRVTDLSIFSSKFTFTIPDTKWVLPVTITGDATGQSSEGSLHLTSGTSNGAGVELRARRHPAYQPNRGHLYSTALILPNPGADGFRRRWGMYFTDSIYQSGVLFELRDGVLYGKTITTYDGVKKENEQVIDYSEFNLEGGALFDIQFQWRGVGNYYFYINQKLVLTLENLGVTDPDNKLSIIDPSLPARFECANIGGTGEVELICGCVDITSEGGGRAATRPQFLESELYSAVDATAHPILIAYVPFDFQGKHNSRDIQILAASLGLDAQGFMKILVTRDKTIFGDAALGDIDGETTDFAWVNSGQSCIKYYSGANLVDLSDPTKYQLAGGGFIPKAGDNVKVTKGDLADEELYLSHGDYLVLVAQKATTGTFIAYGTLFLSEEL